MDPAALTEAEKILGKYPHSFKALYGCARVYMAFGSGSHDPQQLRRALELLEQSRVLLPQNDDPQISESVLCGNLSSVLFLLGEHEKSLELLKRNNAGGIFSSDIGFSLAVYMDRPEDAVPFLSQALLEGLSTLLNTVISYVFVFRSRKDWDSALAVITWGIDLLIGLKTEARTGFLEKTHAEMLALLSYVQAKAGMPGASRDSLGKAAALARRFDSMPDYSLKNLRFTDQADQAALYDVLGITASDGIAGLIGLLEDPEMSRQWKEVMSDGQ